MAIGCSSSYFAAFVIGSVEPLLPGFAGLALASSELVSHSPLLLVPLLVGSHPHIQRTS